MQQQAECGGSIGGCGHAWAGVVTPPCAKALGNPGEPEDHAGLLSNQAPAPAGVGPETLKPGPPRWPPRPAVPASQDRVPFQACACVINIYAFCCKSLRFSRDTWCPGPWGSASHSLQVPRAHFLPGYWSRCPSGAGEAWGGSVAVSSARMVGTGSHRSGVQRRVRPFPLLCSGRNRVPAFHSMERAHCASRLSHLL